MVGQIWLLLCLAAVSAAGAAQSKSEEATKSMDVKRITPILFVQEIEPCVTFWVERFGFNKSAEVPDGNRLGFVILEKDGLEIMYQSFASAEKDSPEAAKEIKGGRTFLYIEVDRLQSILDAVKDMKIAIPLRTAPYGAREIGIKDPSGHVILFAEFAKGKV